MEGKDLWIYIGKGAFIDGIPARNLTQHDWDRLNEDERSAVENQGLYRRAARPKVEEVKQPEKQPEKEAGKNAAAERAVEVKGKKE